MSASQLTAIRRDPPRGRPVACRASISLAAIWSKQRTSNISYSSEMEWGQVGIFFAVACFAAIVLFMVKPQA